MDNRAFLKVKKDVMTAVDSLNEYGAKNPDLWPNFITSVVKLAGLDPYMDVQFSSGPAWKVYRAEPAGTRTAMAAVEASAPQVRSSVKHTELKIEPHLVMVPIEISYDYERHNLEGPAVTQKLVSEVFEPQLSNEIQQMLLFSDANGVPISQLDRTGAGSASLYMKDSLLSMQNGFIRMIESLGGQGVDGNLQSIGLKELKELRTALPPKFKTNRNSLFHLMSIDSEDNLAYKLGTRNTAEGDAYNRTGRVGMQGGCEVAGLGVMSHLVPYVEHITLTGTTPVALSKKNPQSIVVLPTALTVEGTTAPYAITADYVVADSGDFKTIARNGGGTITSGAVVKVFYKAPPMAIHSYKKNLTLVVDPKSLMLEFDKDIFARTHQIALSGYFGWGIKYPEGCVLGRNYAESV